MSIRMLYVWLIQTRGTYVRTGLFSPSFPILSCQPPRSSGMPSAPCWMNTETGRLLLLPTSLSLTMTTCPTREKWGLEGRSSTLTCPRTIEVYFWSCQRLVMSLVLHLACWCMAKSALHFSTPFRLFPSSRLPFPPGPFFSQSLFLHRSPMFPLPSPFYCSLHLSSYRSSSLPPLLLLLLPVLSGSGEGTHSHQHPPLLLGQDWWSVPNTEPGTAVPSFSQGRGGLNGRHG